jgi:hypothetical protein
MQLNSKVYDILKWITMIVLPACATAYVGLAAIWGWPYADQVAKTTAVICTLLGALLGISTAQYNKDNYTNLYDDEEDIYPDEVDDEDE